MPAYCHNIRQTNVKLHSAEIIADGAGDCVNKRQLRRVASHLLAQPIYTLSGCVCNEYCSLVNRHLLGKPNCSSAYETYAKKVMRRIRNGCDSVDVMTLDELYKTRSTHVKRRWRKHLTDTTPVVRKDAYVKAFVKYEKYDAPEKVPRLIQGRSTKFTMHLAKYLVPIEHAVYRFRDKCNSGLRCFAKGRNANQRARDILALDRFPKSAWLEIDHSRFDSRVSAKHLRLTHLLYNSFIDDGEMKTLLSWQINNVGFSHFGLFYRCVGRRMSGDIDTGLGNSLLNYTILRYVMEGIPANIYLDGDDSVVCFDARYRRQVEQVLVERLEQAGMQSTFKFRSSPYDVEFCQSKIIETLNGPTLGRNPIRAISRMCYSLGQQPEGYFGSVCYGEIHSSSGVPLIYDFAAAHVGKPMWERLEYRHKLNLGVKPVAPIDVARVDQIEQWPSSVYNG